MRNLIILFALTTVCFLSCKKEDNNTGITGNMPYIRKKIQPPAGYLFPRTFKPNETGEDFHVYANSIKLTSHGRTQASFWEEFIIPASEFIGDIKLINEDSAEINVLGKKETVPYYFSQDSLIIKYMFGDLIIEYPLAKGNYSGFKSNIAFMYYAKIDNAGTSSKSITSTGTYANLENTLIAFNIENINKLKETDTLAFANKFIDFK